jgi:aldehyde dehydrogenase (NAD+)
MDFLKELGIEGCLPGAYCGTWLETGGEVHSVHSPATGEELAQVRLASGEDYERCARAAQEAFLRWRKLPAPQRGEIVRKIGLALREKKEALGRIVTWEAGKILEEGRGEVQEAIDIADFAVGLSRQLYGLTIKSERPRHHMRETWHPIGPIGVITAFNFPAAVWAWNAMLALVCGDSLIWKPSLKAPLTAIAMTRVVAPVLEAEGFGALATLVIGSDAEVGETMIRDKRLPVISATGSCRMGRYVGKVVAERLGRSLLELGGNNAVIVLEDADLDMALRAILFGAVGTAGQRCTSTRRLLVHKNILPELQERLLKAYASVPVGNPLDSATLMGPLIDEDAVQQMQSALQMAKDQGGEVLFGGEVLELEGELAGGHYVRPCLVAAHRDMAIVQEETFAPILYIISIDSFEEAMEIHNSVPQGLSSALFTKDLRVAETFLSETGSDCGIANINLGTSGAEIGGAFGGEKDTGGGRESGSDAWKAYMRRQTSTVNYGSDLPLAQGIHFG